MLASMLVVEEHDGVRSALRDWLLASFPPLRLCEARSMEEALRLADQANSTSVSSTRAAGANGIEATRALRSATRIARGGHVGDRFGGLALAAVEAGPRFSSEARAAQHAAADPRSAAGVTTRHTNVLFPM